MIKLAILTCEAHPNLIDDDQKLISTFSENGINAAPVIWTRTTEWDQFDCVFIRSPWDYAKRWNEFNLVIDQIAQKTTLIHSSDIIKWNADKSYLLSLESKYIKKVPSLVYENFQETNFIESFEKLNCPQIVFKPLFGASGYQTYNCSKSDREVISPLIGQKVIAQRFLSSIPEKGEVSFVFFGESFSHAVIKKESKGEFRIQEEHGGRVEQYIPSQDQIESIQSIFKQIPFQLSYARVDVAMEEEGFYLMELEVIEPELFFGLQRILR